MAICKFIRSGADQAYRDRICRQIAILGEDGQRKIAATKLTFVGCGGNGSAVILLCALAGFRTMYLVDGDRLEIHNLNRFMLGGVRDVGKHKVFVVKRSLHRLFPGMRVVAFPKAIQSDGVWERAKVCHWLIDATDSDETRHFLQKKCVEDGVPLVSLASGFMTHDNKMVSAGCRVNRVRPNDACLECQVLDEEPMQHAQVSLVVPNMIAAALALDMLLREITGYAKSVLSDERAGIHTAAETDVPAPDDANFVMFDLLARTLIAQRVVPSPHCLLCRRINAVPKNEPAFTHAANLERNER